MSKLLHVGLDVGSTTEKIVVMDEKLNAIYTSYERHTFSLVVQPDICKTIPTAKATNIILVPP